MNHKYTLLALGLTATTAWGQLARPMLLSPAQPTDGHAQVASSSDAGFRGASVWSEDFANGFAGNNGSGAWTLDLPDSQWWVYSHTSPNGAYSSTPTDIINSDTDANGFMMFASDSGNSTFLADTIIANPDFINWDGALVSPVIDLSATPAVVLSFQQRMRYCCNSSPFFVDVSCDGFTSWSTYACDLGLAINTLSGTVTVDLPITGAINEDPANAQFRFHHDGPNSGTSHYHWQIDDISITEAPAYNAHVFDGYVSHTGDGTEYGRIPQNQLGSTINIGGFMDNLGGQPLTNATLNAVVTDNATSTEQFTVSVSTPALAPGDTLIMDEWPTLPALALGKYTITYSASADEIGQDVDPNNNEFLRTFEITSSDNGLTMYSLDQIGDHAPGTQQLDYIGTDLFTGGTDDFWAFTYYKITEDLVVDAIEVDLAPGSQAGALLRVSIHDSTTVVENNDPYSAFTESADHALTPQNLSASKVVIPLPNEYTMTAGSYYAGVVMFSNNNDDQIRIQDDLTVPQPAWASAIHISQDQTYSNGIALGIRLRHFNVGIDEHELAGVGVYPNPSTGLLNVTFTKAGNYLVEVTNVLGEVVHTARMNISTVLDLTELGKGVYNVRVSNEDASTVQRVVLN